MSTRPMPIEGTRSCSLGSRAHEVPRDRLNADTYEGYVVPHLQKNVAKAKAVNPRYRSVLILDEKIYFTPGLSVE